MKRLREQPHASSSIEQTLEAIGDVCDAEAVSVIGYADPRASTETWALSSELCRWDRRSPASREGMFSNPGLSPNTHFADRWHPFLRVPGDERRRPLSVGSDETGSDRGTITLTFPIFVDGTSRGKILIEHADSEVTQTRAELALLELAVQEFEPILSKWVQRSASPTSASPASGSSDSSSSDQSTNSTPTPPPADRLERRIQTERALVEASRLLLASEACDFDRLMEIVGTATGAAYAYLVVITPSDVASVPSADPAGHSDGPFQLDTYRQYEWFGSPEPQQAGEQTRGDAVFAVPILSSDDQLFGYIGIEYGSDAATSRDEDTRILSVLGDLLCSYLQRQVSEEALRRSENRYRHFVDTISEAIWRIDVSPPIHADEPVEKHIEHLLANGTVAECNTAAAEMAGAETPEEILDRPLEELAEWMQTLVREIVRSNYRLRQYEHTDQDDRGKRHFVVNTVGVQEDGFWTGLWGSTTEVTERVQLERRMVASLERQQRRIGRDLHDRVGQQLAGTRMLAQNLAHRHFPEPDQPGRPMIDRIVQYVQEATQHVNDLQRGVMPVQVDRDGLAQALAELASRTGMHGSIECAYQHDGVTDVKDHETKLQLYRIAQEATRNAVLHAEPDTIEVRLETNGDSMLLQVKDDGIGFDDPGDSLPGTAFGLHSMRYRARSIGATLKIDTQPDRGTTVECSLPTDSL